MVFDALFEFSAEPSSQVSVVSFTALLSVRENLLCCQSHSLCGDDAVTFETRIGSLLSMSGALLPFIERNSSTAVVRLPLIPAKMIVPL